MKTTKLCMLGLHLAESKASEYISQESGVMIQIHFSFLNIIQLLLLIFPD